MSYKDAVEIKGNTHVPTETQLNANNVPPGPRYHHTDEDVLNISLNLQVNVVTWTKIITGLSLHSHIVAMDLKTRRENTRKHEEVQTHSLQNKSLCAIGQKSIRATTIS